MPSWVWTALSVGCRRQVDPGIRDIAQALLGICSRHRRSSSKTRSEVLEGSASQSGGRSTTAEECLRPCRRGKPACLTAFRRARSRTPRYRRVCRRYGRGPARGSCRPECRGRFLRAIRDFAAVPSRRPILQIIGGRRCPRERRQTEVEHLHDAVGCDLELAGLRSR